MQEIFEAFFTKVVSLRRSVKTDAELAAALGVNAVTIYRWINRKVKPENISLANYIAVMGDAPRVSLPETGEPATAREIVIVRRTSQERAVDARIEEAREVLESQHPVYAKALTQNIKAFARAVRNERVQQHATTHTTGRGVS